MVLHMLVGAEKSGLLQCACSMYTLPTNISFKFANQHSLVHKQVILRLTHFPGVVLPERYPTMSTQFSTYRGVI